MVALAKTLRFFFFASVRNGGKGVGHLHSALNHKNSFYLTLSKYEFTFTAFLSDVSVGIIYIYLRLNGEDIKRSSDFCYPGGIVTEDGGTSKGSKCENTEGEGIILQIKKRVAIQITTKKH